MAQVSFYQKGVQERTKLEFNPDTYDTIFLKKYGIENNDPEIYLLQGEFHGNTIDEIEEELKGVEQFKNNVTIVVKNEYELSKFDLEIDRDFNHRNIFRFVDGGSYIVRLNCNQMYLDEVINTELKNRS